jgi:hypothetical protein
MPENHGTTGVVAAFIWAVVHTVTVIITNQGQSDTTVAANVLPLVPELCVLLRLKPIVDLSENRSLAALAAIDFLFYLAVGPLSAISP